MIVTLFALALAGPLEEATAAYDAGDWDTAVDVLSAVDDPSGTVLYDLGSAWFRQGDLPRAIAAWRGAARIRPRDGALAHDLAVARGRLPDLPPPVDPPVPWLAFVTVAEVGLTATLLLATASLLLVRRWRRRDPSPPWTAGALALAGAILAGAALHGAHAVVAHPVGVVVDAPAASRDAARPDARERFLLQPGTEVRVERALAGFVLVTTGDGRRGWVPSGSLAVYGVPGA